MRQGSKGKWGVGSLSIRNVKQLEGFKQGNGPANFFFGLKRSFLLQCDPRHWREARLDNR